MAFSKDDKKVYLKGCGNGLRLLFSSSGKDEEIIDEALALIKNASSLVGKSDIIMDVGDREVTESFIELLFMRLIWPLPLGVSCWKSDRPDVLELFSHMGLKLFGDKTGLESPLIITKSLRSGQKVEHRGDVVILGHVHDGSEVLADGNVFIFGRLRGLVHAGAGGDENCFITTDCFMARQIRIGSKVSNGMDSTMQNWWKCPVIISINGDSFNVSRRS